MMSILKSCLSNALDGVINKIGATSWFATVGLFFASGSGAIELSQASGDHWGMTQWLGVLAGVGTLSFILKNLMSFRNECLGHKIKKLDHKLKKLELKEKEKNNPGK